MQKIVKQILSILILVTYMIASIGFGVHECSDNGTKNVLIINSNKSCSDIHDHNSCDSNCCSSGKHSKNCCSTEIHHLDLDYDITEIDSENYLSFSQELVLSSLFAENSSPKAIVDCSLYSEFKHGPPVYLQTNQILAALSQWRL